MLLFSFILFESFHISGDEKTTKQHFGCLLRTFFLLHYIVTRIYKQKEIICMKISKFVHKTSLCIRVYGYTTFIQNKVNYFDLNSFSLNNQQKTMIFSFFLPFFFFLVNYINLEEWTSLSQQNLYVIGKAYLINPISSISSKYFRFHISSEIIHSSI